MEKKDNLKIWVIVLALFLVVTIGYSILSTTLKIKGTTTIKSAKWDIHFEKVTISPNSVTASVPPANPSNSVTSMNYTVDLTQPGDFYEFTVVVKNSGTLDAKIGDTAPAITGVSTEQDVYVNYKVTYEDDTVIKSGDALNAGDSKTIKVRVEYDPNVTTAQMPLDEQTLTLNFSMDYVQA